MIKKSCVICGKAFQHNYPRTLTCSPECRRQLNNARELERRKANPEANRQRVREWYKANPEAKREYDRERYKANPERERERVREYCRSERYREHDRWRSREEKLAYEVLKHIGLSFDNLPIPLPTTQHRRRFSLKVLKQGFPSVLPIQRLLPPEEEKE